MNIFNSFGNEIKKLNNEIIYILCIPYSVDPKNSYERSLKIVKWLREIHKVHVFSPILHTHNYHEFWSEIETNFNEDYYEWDFAIYEALKENSHLIFTSDYQISTGCRKEMEWGQKNSIQHFILKD